MLKNDIYETLELRRTDGQDPAFRQFVRDLDLEFAGRYPHLMAKMSPVHRIENIGTVLVAYLSDAAVGCGCFKLIDEHTIEIKRMYVKPVHRSHGIAARILNALENWGRESGRSRVQLETGILQPDAIRLYEKCGYVRIDNYEPYTEVSESICMEKRLDE